jgi:hypothetical protein
MCQGRLDGNCFTFASALALMFATILFEDGLEFRYRESTESDA